MSKQGLKDIVADKLDQKWDVWAKAHPQLAAAIDRTQLVDAAVKRLREDPQFMAAMEHAAVDEHTLAQASAVLGKADQMIGNILPM